MLEINITAYGSEFYHHHVDRSNFNEKEFLKKHEDNYIELNEDNFDMASMAETSINIHVILNGKEVYNADKEIDELSVADVRDENYRDYSNTKEHQKVVIWGHNCVLTTTHTFNDINDFSIKNLEFYFFKLKDEMFISSICYNGEDADDTEFDMAPKHGYWGPYIY